MGELQHEPFQFAFNGFLKVAFHGSRVTSDAGLILVRELDERLGLETLIAEHLSDSRQGLNTQFSLADQALVAHESPAAAGEDRGPAREACPVLLAAAGRRASDPAALRRHAEEDLGAASAGRLTRGRVQRSPLGEERAQVWSGV